MGRQDNGVSAPAILAPGGLVGRRTHGIHRRRLGSRHTRTGRHQMHTRVEFTTDLGWGPIVAAFVDFSAKSISCGVPYRIRVYTGMPEEGGHLKDVYQRVTVHADGRVRTHLLELSPADAQFDQSQPRLAEWNEPWSRRFEFIWSQEYLTLIRPWFTKPKPETHLQRLSVPVEFIHTALSSIVTICIATPESALGKAASVVPLDEQSWQLTGGWPWVVVAMSNIRHPKPEQLSTVGRDYRK